MLYAGLSHVRGIEIVIKSMLPGRFPGRHPETTDGLLAALSLADDIVLQPEIEQDAAANRSFCGYRSVFCSSINDYLRGYRAKLEPNEQIVVMGLNSATPGRMGIIYYRELLASEFLDRIHDWHAQFAWPQRNTKEYPNPCSEKKPVKKTIWPVYLRLGLLLKRPMVIF